MATTRQLEVFIAVVNAGGFRRAADALEISEASVSKQIKALEKVCGAALFIRAAGKSPILTEDGKRTFVLANETILLQQKIGSREQSKLPIEEVEFITRPYFFETFVRPNIDIIKDKFAPSQIRFTILESTKEIINRLLGNRNSFALIRIYAQKHEKIVFSYLKKSSASIYMPTTVHNYYANQSLSLDDIPSVTPSYNHDVNEICVKEINSRNMGRNLIQSQVFVDEIIEEAIEKEAKMFLLDHHARDAVANGRIVKLENDETQFWLTFACAAESSSHVRREVFTAIKNIIKDHMF